MAGWANGWTLSYVGISATALVLVWLERRRHVAVRWGRVALWVGMAAVSGLVGWSVLTCAWLHFGPEGTIAALPFCVLASSYWAAFVVGAFLPLYSVVLCWYARRYGAEETNRQFVIRSALALGLPGGLWVAYGFAAPFYEIGHSLREGLTYGGFATVTFWIALAGPRLLISRLGPGQLAGRVAA